MSIKVSYTPPEEHKDKLLEELVASNKRNGMPNHTNCWAFEYDDEGNIIGGCKFLLFPNFVWIDELWVSEQHKQRGLGKALLTSAEDEARNKGCLSSYLDTLEFQNAVPFYEKCGYNIIHQLDPMAGNDARYFMIKKLV